MVKNSTRISRFFAAVEDRPVHVGLDVQKKTCPVALFDPQDGIVETYSCPSGEDALAEQLAGRGGQIAHIVDEPGPTGFAVSCSLERAEFAVFAITASRIPRGYAGVAKTDRIDAVKLANYCTRLPFSRSSRRGIAPVRRRSRAAENRGKFKQKIKGLLLASGIHEPVRIQK